MYYRYLIVFCMEVILHEVLKYKFINFYVLIFLHVVCFYFTCYSSILVGTVGLSQYHASPVQCRGSRKFGGEGEFRQFSKFQGGVEEFSGSRGMRIYGGWHIFRIQGEMAYVGQ